ncbi:MAG: carboxypeptidase regulatory-like domain-containing protein [Planctomycetes bacterium]|nr:carboxypeptidase regulatory-like domain-containing protein [Planctomycetota bacterium]
MRRASLILALLATLGVLLFWLFSSRGDIVSAPWTTTERALEPDGEIQAESDRLVARNLPEADRGDTRISIDASRGGVIRGRVVQGERATPVDGIEVLALDRHPAFADFEVRLRDFIEEGFWKSRELPRAEVLARTKSRSDGTFELTGLAPGRVFLDARSDRAYARSYPAVRLARSEVREGEEIVLSPGGRVRGRILDRNGEGIAGARIVLRPSAASFLAQITSRSFRWFEQQSDEDGTFDFVGVPPGQGYALTGVADTIALTQARDVSVVLGRTVDVVLRGSPGARIRGTVRRPDGEVAAGALVGFAYLDLARVLFSVHAGNPVRADENGQFEIPHVGAGQVAVTALSKDLGLAPIERLAIVEGATYDIELSLSLGRELVGYVVDSEGKPVEGATVRARTLEQPRGFDLSLVTKLVRYEATTDAEGRFELQGLLANRFWIEAEHPSYLPTTKVWRERDQEPGARFVLELKRGAFLSGRVIEAADDRPVQRFRVLARSQNIRRMRVGPEWGRPPRQPNPYNDRSPWLRKGEFEIQHENGEFRVGPLEPGKIALSIDADGYLESDRDELELKPSEERTGIEVRLERGVTVRGRVTDGKGGPGIAEAQVTWRRTREGREGPSFLPFKIDIQPEDFDFMALDSTFGSRSVLTDALGNFEFRGVAGGAIDVFARHPAFAKSASKGVEITAGRDREDVVIELSRGGSIAGTIRDLDGKAVTSATIVCFSIASGVIKSATSDPVGSYLIEGLAPGPYVVFKAHVDGALSEIFAKMLGSVRLKSTTVREGRVSRVDIEDRTEGGVDLFGLVTRNGAPVPRAVVTLLGQDQGGPFGIGLRTGNADDKGLYEIASVPPGNYVCRITEYGPEHPEVSTIDVTVAAGTRQRLDLEMPSAVVAGIVVDPDGQPVSGIRLRAIRADGAPSPGGLLALASEFGGASRSRSRADGRFELDRLAPGTWTVRAEPSGSLADSFAIAEVTGLVVSAAEQVSDVRIVLPRAAIVRGIVKDGLGEIVAGATIRLTPHGGAVAPVTEEQEVDLTRGAVDATALRGIAKQLRASSRTGRDGRFAIRGLEPGRYDVTVEKSGLSANERPTITVVLGSNPDVELSMVRSGKLAIRVLDLEGNTLPQGKIRVFDSKGQQVGKTKSLFGVMASLFRGKQDDGGSDWLDMGELAPDRYTLRVEQNLDGGTTSVRETSRVLGEGENARWEVKMADLIK